MAGRGGATPALGTSSLKLPSGTPRERLDASTLSFEVYDPTPRDLVRVALLGCLDSLGEGWNFVRRLGVIPQNSVADKFPYHRAAYNRPEVAVRLSRQQQWVLTQQAVAAQRQSPVPRTTRPKPRYPVRDAFGPGMVVVINTTLAWWLIFSSNVRSSML